MTKAPTLMLRPRALNMIEHHCLVNGKEVSGPLFDFAMLMYHNGERMSQLGIGPYFYISKVNVLIPFHNLSFSKRNSNKIFR